MTEPPRIHRTQKRKPLWFLAVAGLLLLGAALLWPSGSQPDAVRSAGFSTGYQIEDGVVAWRPRTAGEQFVATILSLGLAANSETLRGRTLPLADATSFRTIAGQYGLDRSHVWFRGDLIDGADPASFEVLDFGFSQDNTHLWKGAELVLPFSPLQENNIEIHSELMFSVNTETYLAIAPAVLLPERPATPPTHYCRGWFMMNDAIWLGAQKVLPVDGEVRMLDCDGSIRTVYEDGVGREDTDDNNGLMVIANSAVQRLSRAGDTTLVATMPEPITETRLLKGSVRNNGILLVQGTSGTVYAVGLKPGTPVQNLGRFDALPDRNAILLGQAFWLGDNYFTLDEPVEATAPVVKDHGLAERFGNIALADGALFDGARVVAHPGDMPLRMINDNTLLIGVACYNFGTYVTDVADPAAEARQIMEVCQTMRPPPDVLYDGLRLAFRPALTHLGPSDAHPGFQSYALGQVIIENEADQIRNLHPEFLQGIELRIDGTPISPPEDAWDEQGVRVEPGQSHRWTLQADTNDDPQYWGWTLLMRPSTARAEVFGDAQFYIGRGQFLR